MNLSKIEFSEKNKAYLLRFIELLVLGAFAVYSIRTFFKNQHQSEFLVVEIVRSIVLPVLVFIFILFSTTPIRTRLSPIAFVGLLLSYGGFYLFQFSSIVPDRLAFILTLASVSFYLGIILWSYLTLGRSLGVVPALRRVVVAGPYRFVRHPIYACYLHLGILYAIFLKSLSGLAGFLLIFIGLYLRAVQEELIMSNSKGYVKYLERTRFRFFDPLLSLPIIFFTLIQIGLGSGGSLNREIKGSELKIQLAFPVISLSPLIYDDWGSVFVGNHIYRRFLPEPSRPNVLSVVHNLNFVCTNGSTDINSCPRIRIDFQVVGFDDCLGRRYSAADIRLELESILKAKSWILPGYNFCSERDSSRVCLEGPAIVDLRRRLQNLYFRFGWSKAKSTDHLFGAGPYCLAISGTSQRNLSSGELRPIDGVLGKFSKIYYYTSVNPDEKYDVALYGTPDKVHSGVINILTHTPLGYYLVNNSSLRGMRLPWNSAASLARLREHFEKYGIIYSGKTQFNQLLPPGSIESIQKRWNSPPPGRALRLILPDYIPFCRDLALGLGLEWKLQGINAMAECRNTSQLIEDINKRGFSKWDAFISPLSPGAPGRNAIRFQYFSPDSKESWTGKTKDPDNFFHLIGVGQSFLTVDRKRFCGLQPNSMGLGDVYVSDFIECSD